jgi:chemotaxis signal transduction protein
MNPDQSLARHAADLRGAFDRGFADPRNLESVSVLDMLLIVVAGSQYVIRLDEVTGLFADKAVTRLPGRLPELIGIAGFRGAVVPVYDLRTLLGHPRSAASRWMVIAGRPTAVGLAFDAFGRHLRVARDTLTKQTNGGRGDHAREAILLDGHMRPVISIPSILRSIAARAQGGSSRKEN